MPDHEAAAREVLPAAIYDFVAGGSGQEQTLAHNRRALDAITLTPRVLTATADPRLSSTVLGTDCELPVVVAPMAYQRLLHPAGELLLARAAEKIGVPYTISTLSSTSLEQIAETATTWFQLYWLRDRSVVESLVARAVDAGCRALMVTVDVPVMGRRQRDVANGFALPPDVRPENLVDKVIEAHEAAPGLSAVAVHTASAFEPAVHWRDLVWLRERCPIPLVVKGILDPRDARWAVETGADGVVVSNHGGRQFDGAPASIDALGPVVDAVGNDCTVLLDSGVRSGLDVLKALALGASGVLLGRPLLWALAVAAADEALAELRDELREAMLLAGCPDLEAARELTVGRTPWPTSN
jgi:4-hydroxymandelate oxidase